MDVTALVDDRMSVDETMDLKVWLDEDPELQGHVHATHTAPPPGALGPLLETLEIIGDPAAAALAAALVAWLRTRVGNVTVKLEKNKDGGSATVEAVKVRGLDAQGVKEVADRLREFLNEPPTRTPESESEKSEQQPETPTSGTKEDGGPDEPSAAP